MGGWVSATTALRAPLCLTPHPRGGLMGEKVYNGSHSHPSFPLPQTLRNQKSWGEVVPPRGREQGNHDRGDGKILGLGQMLPGVMPPSRRWQAGTLRNLCLQFPFPSPGISFPLSLPCCWQNLTSGHLGCHSCCRCCRPRRPRLVRPETQQGVEEGEGRGSSWGSLTGSSLQDFLPA